ncbi:hypothetical protein DL89DRAFT_294126 [Linderina pennispora]|uniref:Thioesterase/thiol ester dehydrase-isomerase n=1 Tax=Linderina pennispora TaxID=61395 RepID=A0A1Y1W3S4_9FUNG|nr:uncharacterized protein DL89DRAFT_294126 [Linderina pennispora]ORX68203.1 hypothetical protein DL89DRAFT_294126 [Linderina pennispora]
MTPVTMIQQWAKDAKQTRSEVWDRMDSRQLTLLDQTIRPYLPSSYPPHPTDPLFGDIAEGTALPPAAHLVYFPSAKSEQSLSPDGYHAAGTPPAPFNPLRVGSAAQLVSSIEDISVKERADADPLVFVKFLRETRNELGLSMVERRQLVYMKPVEVQRKIIMLFRYSALTWNSHRIHYDHNYACNIENHPGLLVHGPLTCTLLLQLLQANMPKGYVAKSFEYRAISPMYCQQSLTLNGRWSQRSEGSEAADGSRICELWSTDNEGGITMKGTATVVPVADK